jgi:short-subunit dehydrogenase
VRRRESARHALWSWIVADIASSPVSDRKQRPKSVEEEVGAAGIVGLVNNAGMAILGPLETISIEALKKQFEVNVIGQVAVIQAFLPLLRKVQGRIVNIGSVNGVFAPPYLGAYAASKFALEAVSDALRLELRLWNIHVAIVDPGPIKTPIWEKSIATVDQTLKNIPEQVLAIYEPDLDAMRRVADRNAKKAKPVSLVVEAVVHALADAHPKSRYYVGWGVRFMAGRFRLFSERFRDWLVRKLLRLP